MSDHFTCPNCNDTGIFPPKKGVSLCDCQAAVKGLDAAAEILVKAMRDFDPTYRMRIDGVVEERHLTPLQLCGRMFSYVLRNSLQNEPVDDLLFQEGYAGTAVDGECEWCRKTLQPQWPGQKYHSAPCTQQAREAGLLPKSKSERPKPKAVATEAPKADPEFVDEQPAEQ